MNINNGLDDRDQYLSLLKQGFDGRSEEHVAWKYDNFPEFDEEHVFTAYDDGKLVGLRRLVYKELISDEQTVVPLFVGSDIVVTPEYRDEGVFSNLLTRSNRYEKRKDTQLSISFNRKGYVTFETKRWLDWKYRPLPLYVRVLSPKKAIPYYASLAFDDTSIPEWAIDNVVTSAILSLSGRLFPSPVVASLVEIASSDTSVQSLRRHFEFDKTPPNQITAFEQPLQDEQIKGILELYNDTSGDFDLYFRREQRDVEHMLSHPYLETVLVAENDSVIVGFAPIITLPIGDVTEARALDIVAKDNSVFRGLVSRFEQEANERDIDLLSMITNREPACRWAKVDKQTMMWDWNGNADTDPIPGSKIQMGFYDVV